MQKKTANYLKGAAVGLAVGAAVTMISNSKAMAGMSLKRNVSTLAKSVNGITNSIKMMVR